MFKNIVIVGVGGFTGAIARFLVYQAMGAIQSSSFPWATLIVNVVGSTLLGITVGLKVGQIPYLVFAVGFLGAFTTFSTFSLDTLGLYESGGVNLAALNIVLNLFFCIAGLYLGRWVVPS